MPFGKHGVLGKSIQERVLEDPESIGKAITICKAKEIGCTAGADGMQTAIRQCRQTEIILARLRQGAAGVQRDSTSPAPAATPGTLCPLQPGVPAREMCLEKP